MPGAAFTIAVQTWIVACAKAIKITLGRLVFQSAENLKGLDGDVSVTYALPQGLFHCLRVVHLAIAYPTLLKTEAIAATIGILHKLLRGYVFDAAIHHVAPQHLFRVGMVAQELQFGSKRAEGCLHTTALLQLHRRYFLQQAEEMLHLALAGVAVFGTELVDGFKVILALYNGLGIEQGLAVVTLRGARLQFKEYSVGLTWHSGYIQILIYYKSWGKYSNNFAIIHIFANNICENVTKLQQL